MIIAALVQRLSIPACHAGDVSSILICCSKYDGVDKRESRPRMVREVRNIEVI